MTPAQQVALTELMGRALTLAEIEALDPLLDPNNRNDVSITGIINAGQTNVFGKITVEEVFDVLYKSGDYAALKTAQLAGNPAVVMAFASLYDAKQIGGNVVNFTLATTISLLDQLTTAGLISAVGRSALEARATKKSVVKRVDEISRALNVAEGRMVL